MTQLGYKLYVKRDAQRKATSYRRQELEPLTTLQLRDICHKEKLVKAISNTLNREMLIETILNFRGSNEEFLIRTYNEAGYARIKKLVKEHLGDELGSQGKIKQPAKLTIYEGITIGKGDRYQVETDNLVVESNVLLLDDEENLCAIFTLTADEERYGIYYLCKDATMPIQKAKNRNYRLLYFKKGASEIIFNHYFDHYYEDANLFEGKLDYYEVAITNVEIRPLETTETILAIDFGTSNTTAGAYLDENYVKSPNENDITNKNIKINEINYVQFENTAEDNQWIELLPTVVSVRDCEDELNIQFDFGYDAIRHVNRTNNNSIASVFYEIKRWVGSYEQIVEIVDYKGNVTKVWRGEIIKAYLKYVISVAEQQMRCKFKNIHITSPVKLKQQSLDMFVNLLSDYHIETENALDEGISVLYNTIAKQIENDTYIDGERYKALIIDCGGGTTDISSCSFKIENGELAFFIDIQTTFENGDTNFGGNNLTYRIMQYIKIVFADYYSKEGKVKQIDDILDVSSLDIYRAIDNGGIKAVYGKLEELYEEAERILPTRFREYENQSKETYQMVRGNFYFFWRLADDLKKDFFRKSGIFRSTFHTKGRKKEETDLKVTVVDSWRIAMNKEDEGISFVYDLPNLEFNVNEMQTLIKGDIYYIMKKFLEAFYDDYTLQDYSIIKLTGQSCRIDVFKDALKEFIPGRSIEFRQQDQSMLDLKLSCLSGVIRYLNAKDIGYVTAKITNLAPVTPYSIIAYKHDKKEQLLIARLEKINQTIGNISRNINIKQMEFFLRDAYDGIKCKYIYRSNIADYKPITYEEINTDYQEHIIQDEVDSIINDSIKFFIFASDNKWGFFILPVARKNGQLLAGEKKFFPFENDQWEMNFFDGLK